MSSLNYDRETALVVVDVQNDFADPDGSLFVSGAADVIAAVNREVIAAIATILFESRTRTARCSAFPRVEAMIAGLIGTCSVTRW